MSVQEAAFSHAAFLPRHGDSIALVPEPPSHESFDLRPIGKLLREAREGKGLSLSEVAEFLLIKKSTVSSIELGDWRLLPHPVYVKGYVKSYAAYLDVYDRIEDLCLKGRPRPKEGLEEVCGAMDLDPEKPLENEGFHWPLRPSLRRIALICSSVTGLILGIAFSPGLQIASPISLKDVLTACHVAVTGLRRVILP